ncbi:hypothetical protein F3N42_02340 [Marinihelvus fidelis]|uniref:Uncharacterized protein n=1 Tax=Marinihelvus fidelis TaxID=2613842 RepID=A0A5N0TFA7_9GAMM|nr:gamma-glutamyl-gamma-aminobutyrate hydrolase family protein [Marinihelvus fidelis]KAA9133218.1 hypothetical protein F3N42_02340 [Marinihelvus fidelis]
MKRMLASQRLLRLPGTSEVHQALDTRWAAFFHALGWCLVPAQMDASASAQFEGLEARALLLSGGNDLASVSDSALSRQRDHADRQLLAQAEARQRPVIGICRGMQFHVVESGGQLVRTTRHGGTRHELAPGDATDPFNPGDFVRQDLASYHHWQVTHLADHYDILARADDGSPEAVIDKQSRFLGIMWHPERADPFDARDLSLVRTFLEHYS